MSYEAVSRNDRELQRTMYLMAELLGILLRCRHDPRQSSQVQREIFAATERLVFLIQEREYTMVGASEQKPIHIKLGARPLCPECIQRVIKTRRDTKVPEATVITPPIWQPALEFVFACTGVVADELFDAGASWTVEQFLACLISLRSALQRMQKFLPPNAVRETTIEIENHPDCCAECGKAIEVAF